MIRPKEIGTCPICHRQVMSDQFYIEKQQKRVHLGCREISINKIYQLANDQLNGLNDHMSDQDVLKRIEDLAAHYI